MTTIILTIIGILLAAAAALMVIFYGGDAFNSGSIGAKANTLQNAGTNVESAATLYKTEQASNAASVAALVSANYLKEAPALTGVGTFGDDISGGKFLVSGVSDDVCKKVEKNLTGVQPASIPASAAVGRKMGCYGTVANANTFFASL